MKALILIAGFIALFTLSGGNLYACSCSIPSSSKIEAMTDAEFSRRVVAFDGAVFLGRVVKESRAMSSVGGSRGVTFAVERYWKGDGARWVTVYTSSTEAACGVTYEVGERHLVVATRFRGYLQTGLCAQLGATKNRAALLRKLGRGERPKS